MKRVFTCIGFSMAVALLVANLIPTGYILISIIGLAVLFIASLLMPMYRQAIVFPLSFLSAIIACSLFLVVNNNCFLPNQELVDTSENCTFYVLQEENSSSNYNYYIAKTEKIGRENKKIKVYLSVDKNIKLEPYSVLDGRLEFSSIEDNYNKGYLKSDFVFIEAKCEKFSATGKYANSLNRYIVNLRNQIKNKLSYIIGDEEGALATALVIGDKSLLSNETKTAFRFAGASHIMAISGLHLSVITGVLLFILKKLRLNEKIRNIILIILVLFYMSLTGFTGSITRAGIMMIVMLSATFFSARSDGLNSLGVAVAIICFNPYAVTDIGTLLSVLAVLSMVTVYKWINSKMINKYEDPLTKTTKEKVYDRIYKLFSVFYTSLVVSIFTIPALYVFFGYASIVGPVSNLLILPLGSTCVVLSIITAFVSFIGINPITTIFAFVTKKLCYILICICKYFASFNNSTVAFDYTFGLIIAGVLLIIGIAYMFGTKRAIITGISMSMIMSVLLLAIFGVQNKNTAKMYVSKYGAVVISCDNKNVVWGVNNNNSYYDIKNYLQLNRMNVDLLVVNNSTYYSSMLSNDFAVNTIVCNTFDDFILAESNHNDLIVQNYCDITLDDNFKVCYNYKEITASVYGVTISSWNNADIRLKDEYILDKAGTISLNDGEIIYTIYDDKSFTVRRFNEWQK